MKFIPNTRYLSAFGKNIPSQKIPAICHAPTVLNVLPQVAQMLILVWVLTPVIQQVYLWSALLNQGTPAPLSMVQTHLTPTLPTAIPQPPRIEWPPSPSLVSSKETPPTTSWCLQRVAPSVWGCGGNLEQVLFHMLFQHSIFNIIEQVMSQNVTVSGVCKCQVSHNTVMF